MLWILPVAIAFLHLPHSILSIRTLASPACRRAHFALIDSIWAMSNLLCLYFGSLSRNNLHAFTANSRLGENFQIRLSLLSSTLHLYSLLRLLSFRVSSYSDSVNLPIVYFTLTFASQDEWRIIRCRCRLGRREDKCQSAGVSRLDKWSPRSGVKRAHVLAQIAVLSVAHANSFHAQDWPYEGILVR